MTSIPTVAAVQPLNEDLMIVHQQHVIDQLRQVRRQQDDEFFAFMEQNGQQQHGIDQIRQIRRQQDDEFFAVLEHSNTMRECNTITVLNEVPEDPFEEIRADYEDEVRYDMEYLDERARMGLPNLLSRNPTGI